MLCSSPNYFHKNTNAINTILITVFLSNKWLYPNFRPRLIFQNVLKESVTSCLVDKTTEVIGDHVGIWDRPKRTTAASAPTGGAYMIDLQNYIVLARNIKVR